LTLRNPEDEKAGQADSFQNAGWSHTVDHSHQAPSLEKESAVIFADSLPGFKGLLRPVALPFHALGHVAAFVAAFALHQGTMSCTQAATLFRQHRRHVATLTRFLCAVGHSSDLLVCVRSACLLLEAEFSQPGDFVFILDGTKRHSQGRDLENSFSCGNTRRTPRKDRRGKGQRKQYKSHPSRCHFFICGLLLTPGGLRLPYCRPYYTEQYCQQIDRPFGTDAELAAEMILALELPAAARVVVVGDTAYDAAVIKAACAQRNYRWVVPVNPERVLAAERKTFELDELALAGLRQAKVPEEVLAKLAGLTAKVLSRESFVEQVRQTLSADEWKRYGTPLLKHGKQKRRKVRELQEELSSNHFEPVRLSLEGPYRLQRRCSASRGGLGQYRKRTYWVHRRTEDVHSVATVVLLFSKKTKVEPGCEKPKVDKIVMSNAFEASLEELVAWYDLRWQVELFFKECKSVLGLDHYRLGKFSQVEGWVELCLLTFCYLEWYRAKQLRRTDLGREEKQFWQRARAHDLCQLVRQRLEEEEVERMGAMMETAEGRRELTAALRDACSHARRSPKAA
jgi:hypothetical protein